MFWHQLTKNLRTSWLRKQFTKKATMEQKISLQNKAQSRFLNKRSWKLPILEITTSSRRKQAWVSLHTSKRALKWTRSKIQGSPRKSLRSRLELTSPKMVNYTTKISSMAWLERVDQMSRASKYFSQSAFLSITRRETRLLTFTLEALTTKSMPFWLSNAMKISFFTRKVSHPWC